MIESTPHADPSDTAIAEQTHEFLNNQMDIPETDILARATENGVTVNVAEGVGREP